MRTSETINELVTALVKARAAFKPVVRDATGQVGQNRSYKYADLAGLLEATMHGLLTNGLVVVQAVDEDTLVTRLAHTSGQWLESAYPLRAYERPQEFGSQLTYARRYSLLGLLGVAQEDDDGRAAQEAKPQPPLPPLMPEPSTGRVISKDQVGRLWTIAQKKGWTKDSLKAWLITMGYQSSKDIPVAHYDDIASGIEEGPPRDLVGLMERAAVMLADYPQTKKGTH